MPKVTTRTANTIITTAAFVLLAAIFGFVSGAAFSKGCSDVREAAFGCVEFFLNRYQTVIGIVAALVAAALTARPVWRQLQEMQRQSATQIVVLLRTQHAVVAADDEISGRALDLAEQTRFVMRQMEKYQNTPMRIRAYQNGVIELLKDANKLLDDFSLRGFHHWGDTSVQAARDALGVGIAQLIKTILNVEREISLLNPEEMVHNLFAVATKHMSAARTVANELKQAAGQYHEAADGELLRLQALILRLEKAIALEG